MLLTSLLSTPRPPSGLACARCSACPAEVFSKNSSKICMLLFPAAYPAWAWPSCPGAGPECTGERLSPPTKMPTSTHTATMRP